MLSAELIETLTWLRMSVEVQRSIHVVISHKSTLKQVSYYQGCSINTNILKGAFPFKGENELMMSP